MKKIIYTLFLLFFSFFSIAQTNNQNSVSEQIILDRDLQLKEMQSRLNLNEVEIDSLTVRLSQIRAPYISRKIATLDTLQKKLENKIKILEETPKIKIASNGQLAFTELLSIQKDIQPANLYLATYNFHEVLGKIDNLQSYPDFKDWKVQYDNWYKKKAKDDLMLEFVNNSINLISDNSNEIPLYGSITQTVTSGIAMIISKVGSRNKNLLEKTPKMLNLLNGLSQFETEKSIIDNEWNLIEKELKNLEIENNNLLKSQFEYFKIDTKRYENEYVNSTLSKKKDDFKNYCRKTIQAKLKKQDQKNDNNWQGEVQKYMYKVQSLRIRFGQLTSRMLLNIDKYEGLFNRYSDPKKNLPDDLVMRITNLKSQLENVRGNFVKTFKPSKYIEDSAVMYIETIKN